MYELLIEAGVLLIIFLVGTKIIEKRHYKSIKKREAENVNIPVINVDSLKEDRVEKAWLVTGSMVISIDLFKKFVANIINIFGGNIVTYETLLDRARREATLRMLEAAKKEGADAIINTRVETSSISKNAQKNQIGSVEILAYGTAIKHTTNA